MVFHWQNVWDFFIIVYTTNIPIKLCNTRYKRKINSDPDYGSFLNLPKLLSVHAYKQIGDNRPNKEQRKYLTTGKHLTDLHHNYLVVMVMTDFGVTVPWTNHYATVMDLLTNGNIFGRPKVHGKMQWSSATIFFFAISSMAAPVYERSLSLGEVL